MTVPHQRRVDVLTRLDARTLSRAEAAELLGVSPRQVRRSRTRLVQEGMAAVLPGNQGRGPANRTDPQIVAQIRTRVGPGGAYHDLNVCHLQELLGQQEGIMIGRSTLDHLLKHEGVRQGRRDQPAQPS